jgi:peptide subunit release factor 1 (eRF1)
MLTELYIQKKKLVDRTAQVRARIYRLITKSLPAKQHKSSLAN